MLATASLVELKLAGHERDGRWEVACFAGRATEKCSGALISASDLRIDKTS